MIEAGDVARYTERKQEIQLILEEAFKARMAEMDVDAFLDQFLSDPRGFTRAFLETAVAEAVKVVLPEARSIGEAFARKVTE